MNTQEAQIETDTEVPLVHVRCDVAATSALLMRAHLDPALFATWVGLRSLTTVIDYWDARTGGSYVGEDRIEQTFTWEGQPDSVALATLTFTDLRDGLGRLHAQSLCDSFAARDAWVASGMESGVNEGYAKLDEVLSDDAA